MEPYIYLNYAYNDYEFVRQIAEQMEHKGLNIVLSRRGQEQEEQVAGSACIIHLCSEETKRSRTFRKIMNYALKHEVDSILLHIKKQTILSELDLQLDAMMALFKCKYHMPARIQEAEAEGVKDSFEENVSEGQDVIEKTIQTANDDRPEEAVPHIVVIQEEEKETVHTSKNQLFDRGMEILSDKNGSPKEAVFYLHQAASQGHSEAQYQLSMCYEKGLGVTRSIVEAVKWCQMAAYAGHVQAQTEIGYCYEAGRGVTRNVQEAVKWYQMAAEQGNVEAKNNLAFCYQKGRGVSKNAETALKLYREAAEGGNASAQYNLGFCYWYGEGVEMDKKRAISLFQLSAKNGNVKAGQMLKILNQHHIV